MKDRAVKPVVSWVQVHSSLSDILSWLSCYCYCLVKSKKKWGIWQNSWRGGRSVFQRVNKWQVPIPTLLTNNWCSWYTHPHHTLLLCTPIPRGKTVLQRMASPHHIELAFALLLSDEKVTMHYSPIVIKNTRTYFDFTTTWHLKKNDFSIIFTKTPILNRHHRKQEIQLMPTSTTKRCIFKFLSSILMFRRRVFLTDVSVAGTDVHQTRYFPSENMWNLNQLFT